MKMIKQGAEAKLFLTKLENQKVIVKDRIRKKYRLKQIDEKIRKTRTSVEYNLLSNVRRIGVPTPKILDVDKKKNTITMEYLDGKLMKDIIDKSDKKSIEKTCFEIGKLIGKLHSNNIVHGDLTTSNMIMKDGKIYFIDFGLGFFSRKIEDHGTDLKLLYEAFKSTHFKVLNICWKNTIKGYKKEYSNADKILKRVEEIQKRARYRKR